MAILAIVGMPVTGKSEVVRHLTKNYGMRCIYFGGYVLQKVRSSGLEETPESERKVREQLRREYGMNAMATLAMPDLIAGHERGDRVVIDGLYSYAEYELLFEQFGEELIVVAIHSNRLIREQRAQQRKIRPLTASELMERDHAEVTMLDKGGPIAIADFHILNNGARQVLEQSIDEIVCQLTEMNRQLKGQSPG